MIALVVRGFVLFGVVGWYSTSVWKMIDGYFKDKFDKYLQDEYNKNPHMRKNLQEQQKSINQLNQQIDQIVIVTENENKSQSIAIPELNIFLSNQSIDNQSQILLTITENLNNSLNLNENKIEIKKKSDDDKSSYLSMQKRTKSKSDKVVEQSKKKQKIKTLMLTEEDFKSTKIKAIKDYDFSEFEDDEKRQPVVEGTIPVAKLPYKPKADIGDLDRITEDEFCPISLDYDEECGETKRWP